MCFVEYKYNLYKKDKKYIENDKKLLTHINKNIYNVIIWILNFEKERIL